MSSPPPPDGPHVVPPLPVRRFTVDEYHRMITAGILEEGEPYELLEGWIVPKMTHSPRHAVVLALADDEIGRRLPPGWFRRLQSGLTTTPESEPEPDVAVVRGQPRDYWERHPGPHDTGLVVEVADSSLGRDRTIKGPHYARVEIPIYWIVNIPGVRVEVHTDPTGPDPAPCYRRRQDYGPADQLPLVLGGAVVGRIPVSDLLP